jgi:hypothetical protein
MFVTGHAKISVRHDTPPAAAEVLRFPFLETEVAFVRDTAEISLTFNGEPTPAHERTVASVLADFAKNHATEGFAVRGDRGGMAYVHYYGPTRYERLRIEEAELEIVVKALKARLTTCREQMAGIRRTLAEGGDAVQPAA